MSSKIVLPIVVGLCALLMAAPAMAADACTKLANARWVGYMEGPFGGSDGKVALSILHLDFPKVGKGRWHGMMASPKSNPHQGTLAPVACAPTQVNPSASTARLTMADASIVVKVATDGKSLTINPRGFDPGDVAAHLQFMSGWAARVP